MADGMVKSVSQEQDSADIQEKQPSSAVPSFHGVPLDLMSNLGIDMSSMGPRTERMLKDIHRMLDGESISDKFKNLIEIKLRIGRNHAIPEVDRIWNWLRINRNIREAQRRNMSPEVLEREIVKQQALEVSGGK